MCLCKPFIHLFCGTLEMKMQSLFFYNCIDMFCDSCWPLVDRYLYFARLDAWLVIVVLNERTKSSWQSQDPTDTRRSDIDIERSSITWLHHMALHDNNNNFPQLSHATICSVLSHAIIFIIKFSSISLIFYFYCFCRLA